MASPFDPLIDIIHSKTLDSWKERNDKALAALFGTRYSKRAEKSVTLRAPEMKGGNDAGVPRLEWATRPSPDNDGRPLQHRLPEQGLKPRSLLDFNGPTKVVP